MDSKAYLKKCKLKITDGRTALLDLLLASTRALTVDYLYKKILEEGISINLSTIYRTLEQLEQKNLIHKFDLGTGKYSYKLKEEEHKHILQCSLCQKEVEIDCPMEPIKEIIEDSTGFSQIEHELRIKGICEECKRRKKS